MKSITQAEFARQTGLSPQHITNLIRDGKLVTKEVKKPVREVLVTEVSKFKK